jgi:hypothetical protein
VNNSKTNVANLVLVGRQCARTATHERWRPSYFGIYIVHCLLDDKACNGIKFIRGNDVLWYDRKCIFCQN